MNHRKHLLYIVVLSILTSCLTGSYNKNDQLITQFQDNLKAYELVGEDFNRAFRSNDSILKNDQVTAISDSLKRIHYYKSGEKFLIVNNDSVAIHLFEKGLDVSNNYSLTQDYNAVVFLFNLNNATDYVAENIALVNEFSEKKYQDSIRHDYYIYSLYQIIYTYHRNYELAESYINKSLDRAKELGENELIVHNLLQKSDLLQLQGKNKLASKLLDSVLTNTTIESLPLKAAAYGDAGVYFYFNGEFSKAIDRYKESLSLFKSINESRSDENIAIQYSNIAEAYIDLKEYQLARVYLDSFYSLNQQNISNKLRKSVLKYEMRLGFEDNYTSNRIHRIIDSNFDVQDSFYNAKMNKELKALIDEKEATQQLKIEKKDLEIDRLKWRNNLFIVVFILLLAAVFLFFFLKKRKQELSVYKLQMQQKLLRLQMNPHFTFNVINSLRQLVKVDPETSSSYMNKFARLLRLILENSTQEYVPLEDEIEVIEKYLDLQQLRFPNLFQYEVVLDGFEKEELLQVPPMLIQPFVENAVEHGFKGLDYTGDIRITLSRKHHKKSYSFLNCTVEDNGIGFERNSSNKKSLSVSLINDYIKKVTREPISITSTTNFDSGTIVTFKIPCK